MPQNAGTFIGLESLYYAIMTADATGGVTYSAPVQIHDFSEFKFKPKENEAQYYGDNTLAASKKMFANGDLELTFRSLDNPTRAALLGHTYTGGLLEAASTDSAPFVCILFKQTKDNGAVQYVKLLKVKFGLPELAGKTQGEKADYQDATISGTAYARVYDKKWIRIADSEDADYIASIGTDWFTAVESAPSALTVTPTPVDEAASVSKTAPGIKWVFNNAIQSAYATDAYFTVLRADTGAAVAGTVAIDTAHTTVTFTPGSALAATTLHVIKASRAITDVYGQVKATNTQTTFTTGS